MMKGCVGTAVSLAARKARRRSAGPAGVGFCLALAALTGGPAGAAPPDASAPEPRIFAPGEISGPGNEGAPTFTPDGRTLFFEQTNGSWTTIVESHLIRGHWSKPALAPFADRWSSQQPTLSPDGRVLIFESTRPDPALGKPHTSAHLYRVDRTAAGWSAPVELPATVNIARRVFKPSIAANGDLYFMADVGHDIGAPPQWRLHVARYVGGHYAQAEQLAFSDGQYSDVDPYIAPDQRYLIFSARDRPPFKDGHEHLFVTYRRGTGWSAPEPLRYAGDQSGADDGEAQVGPDGRTLYFTSGRVVNVAPDRSRVQVVADLARMALWNNGNSNVWTVPLPDAAQARSPSRRG